MEKATRAELIASLVTDKFSGFKDGDEANLEAFGDARLEEFRASSEARRTESHNLAKQETENRNLAARLKVAEERIKASEQPLSEEDFMQRAPAQFKSIIEERRAEEATLRSALIGTLKDCGAHSEEELKTKSTDELRSLAKYARVEVPDYSGRGLPKERNAENRPNYAPPDAYGPGLKAMREAKV